MRKRDAVQKLRKILQEWDGCLIDTKAAKQILEKIQKEIGMSPPRLSEDYCQAIMSVYYAGYTFNQWEEDANKDESVMKALDKRKKPRRSMAEIAEDIQKNRNRV